MSGSLTLVATPLGNLGDISPRARDALSTADLVLCEDTRVTAKLLGLLNLKAPLKRCDAHRELDLLEDVVDRVRKGERLTLVSDAGTPLISDPGFALVRAVREAGLPVTAVPGPAAPILALILSGLPTDRFFFGGFLPPKPSARRAVFEEVKGLRATLIFFENPKRLAACLADGVGVFGPRRPASTVRELTKRYEQVRTASLGDLAAHYGQAAAPKGELVLLVGPALKQADTGNLDALLAEALHAHPPSAAAREVAKRLGLPKSQVYARALALQRDLSKAPPLGQEPSPSTKGLKSCP